jgi:hypothetical protein
MRINIHRLIVAAGALSLIAISTAALQQYRNVKVESKDGRRATVYIGRHTDVRLTRQLSDAPCRRDRTWGEDSTHIWTDDGCRAEFSYRTISTDRDDDVILGGTTARRITVESNDGRRHYSRIDTTGGVRLVRQLSDKPCTYGRTWDYDRNGIWVDRGCRAIFEVGRARGTIGGGVNPRRGEYVPGWAVGTFRSTDREYRLKIDPNGDVTLRGRAGGNSNDYSGTFRNETIRIRGGTYEVEQRGDGLRMRNPFGSGWLNFTRNGN